jgi:hypothetical protein
MRVDAEENLNGEPLLLITADEAARRLSVCKKTLWNLTQPRGPIPVVRIGGGGSRHSVRYSPVQIEKWIAEQLGEDAE